MAANVNDSFIQISGRNGHVQFNNILFSCSLLIFFLFRRFSLSSRAGLYGKWLHCDF